MLKQKGFLLVVAVWCILIIGLMVSGITYLSVNQFSTSNHIVSTKRADNLAYAATEKGLYQLSGNNCSSVYSSIDTSLSTGEFRYKCDYFNAGDTLNGSINDSTTTISLDDASNLSPLGEVQIDSESIYYNQIENNNLIGVRRGANGTTAASHSNGSVVSQDNYIISGLGASPSIASPLAQSTYSQAASMAQGLAGHAAGNNAKFYYYNGSTWTQSQSVSNKDIYALVCTSSSNCWAAGKNGKFYNYNGATWSNTQSVGNEDVRAIACTNLSDCWAAGKKGKFYYYNGSTWTQPQTVGNKNINAINCIASNNCWAAGQSAKFYHYNGVNWSEEYELSGKKEVRALSCIATNDCWAAGKNARFYHYDGSSWSQQYELSGKKEVKALYCVASNDCWAAGKNARFYYYDGSSWSQQYELSGKKEVKALHCAASNDCWAAGYNARFYYYDGSSWSQVSLSVGNSHVNALYINEGAAAGLRLITRNN